MSKQLRLDPAQLTDVGRKRPHNEDNMAHVIPKDPVVMGKQGALFIVADGMGGHAAGEIASEIAVDTVSKVYYQEDSDEVPALLLRSIKRANALIHQRASENMLRSGMGTTCVAAILRGNSAFIANVGDSRAYLIRGGQIKRVSQDHSWVEEQVRAGLLSEEQARSHAQRNVITRCLGTQAEVEVDIFYEQLQEGDTLLLCSDGLSGLVSDDDMRTIVEQHPPQESVYHLVERANENGGHDNITVIVVRVVEVGIDPPGTRVPVYSGGGERIADEDTLSLSMLPGKALALPGMAPRPEDMHTTATPFRYSSGPLILSPNEGAATAFPSQTQRRRRSRLFYPTLALFMLILVSTVAGGLYYLYVHNKASDINASLQHAHTMINLATSETQGGASNPTDALQKLAMARTDLLAIQNAARNAEQDKQFKSLQTSLVTAVTTAINTYNTASKIVQLPCTTVTPATIPIGSGTNGSNGTTGTQATTIASIKDQKNNVFSYALGANGILYQLSPQGGLIMPLTLNGPIQKIASDGVRILALTQSKGTPTSYSLHLLIPDPGKTNTGQLKDSNASTIDTQATADGNTPIAITAWGSDAYVVITSTTTSTTTASVLDYTIDTAKNTLNKPSRTQFSYSYGIVSAAAYPDHQLFLLYGDGSIWSLNHANGNGTQNTTPQTAASVLLSEPVASPLPLGANEYTSFTQAIPQVPPLSPKSLSLPGSSLLVAGQGIDNKPHLYVADSHNHRVLDFTATGNPSTGTPSAAPTATPSANANAGGGVASSTPTSASITMSLQQQYTSAHLLASVNSFVAHPKESQLYLLALNDQHPPMLNLITMNTGQSNTACTPTP